MADDAQDLADQIPSARFYAASVAAGSDVYVLAGKLGNGTVVSDVLKYASAVGGNATKVGDLKFAVDSISAIWNGSAIFVFGGDNDGDKTRIVRYNVTNDTSDVVANFASSRAFTSAVRVGNDAYIFGGVGAPVGNETYRDEVVRFNTTSFAVDVVLDNESFRRAGTSAVWDGTHAFIFTGTHCPVPEVGFDHCDDIVRYTPSNNSVAVMGAKFPSRFQGTAAAWDGSAAYIIGDHTGDGTNVIFRYRPSDDNLTTMSDTLPLPRGWTNAVFNGTSVYVATGRHGANATNWPKAIVRYNLTPGQVQSFNASSNSTYPLEIRLNWTPPADNTYTSPITNYTLRRGPLGEAKNFTIVLGNVLSHTDTANLTGGTTYCYDVTAKNAQGEGAPYPQPPLEVCAVAYPCIPPPGSSDCILP